MRRRVTPLLVLVVLLVGCVSTNATRLGGGPARNEVAPADVRIYRTPDQVPAKYDEIAILHAEGEAGWTDEEDMYESMREKAGELGANAIILEGIDEPSAGAKVAGAIFGTGSERKGEALAIFVYYDSREDR